MGEFRWIGMEGKTKKKKKKAGMSLWPMYTVYGIYTDKQTYPCWQESQKLQWLAGLPRNGLHQQCEMPVPPSPGETSKHDNCWVMGFGWRN